MFLKLGKSSQGKFHLNPKISVTLMCNHSARFLVLRKNVMSSVCALIVVEP